MEHLLNYKEEWRNDILYNMNEPWKHVKEDRHKTHILYVPFIYNVNR